MRRKSKGVYGSKVCQSLLFSTYFWRSKCFGNINKYIIVNCVTQTKINYFDLENNY